MSHGGQSQSRAVVGVGEGPGVEDVKAEEHPQSRKMGFHTQTRRDGMHAEMEPRETVSIHGQRSKENQKEGGRREWQ